MGTQPVAVKLDPDMKERLLRLAAAKKRSPHWIMREALREYTEREERVENLRQETLKRWEAYKITGETVDNEAVMAWLDTWGSEHETERPSCEK
jgi:predicted transcriptional regulator